MLNGVRKKGQVQLHHISRSGTRPRRGHPSAESSRTIGNFTATVATMPATMLELQLGSWPDVWMRFLT